MTWDVIARFRLALCFPADRWLRRLHYLCFKICGVRCVKCLKHERVLTWRGFLVKLPLRAGGWTASDLLWPEPRTQTHRERICSRVTTSWVQSSMKNNSRRQKQSCMDVHCWHRHPLIGHFFTRLALNFSVLCPAKMCLLAFAARLQASKQRPTPNSLQALVMSYAATRNKRKPT